MKNVSICRNRSICYTTYTRTCWYAVYSWGIEVGSNGRTWMLGKSRKLAWRQFSVHMCVVKLHFILAFWLNSIVGSHERSQKYGKRNAKIYFNPFQPETFSPMRPHGPILSLFIPWYSTFVQSIFFFLCASGAWYSHCFYDIRPKIYFRLGQWTYQFSMQKVHMLRHAGQRKTIRPLLMHLFSIWPNT